MGEDKKEVMSHAEWARTLQDLHVNVSNRGCELADLSGLFIQRLEAGSIIEFGMRYQKLCEACHALFFQHNQEKK